MYKYKRLQPFQLPREHLSFLQNLQSFIVTKYLKQEVDDDLSICVDARGPCGLSLTGDIKIYYCLVIKKYDVTTPSGEVSTMDFYQGVVFTAQIS